MRERGVWVIACIPLLLVLAYYGYLYLTSPVGYYPFENREPLFLGYSSEIIRIESVNITLIEKKARLANYSVSYGLKEGMSDEWIDGTGPFNGTRLWFVYTYDSDYTYFDYTYQENDTDAVEWIWALVADSFNLSDENLNRVKEDAYSNYEMNEDGVRFGCYIDGLKPDWEKVMAHLGSITKIDKSNVGLIGRFYDSGLELWLNDSSIMVEKSVSLDVTVGMNIDRDSDFILYIDSGRKLDDPKKLYVQVFEDLGLPKSVLDSVELEERYAYTI
jgi:hypothetical protein